MIFLVKIYVNLHLYRTRVLLISSTHIKYKTQQLFSSIIDEFNTHQIQDTIIIF